jgi:hypothetical protein
MNAICSYEIENEQGDVWEGGHQATQTKRVAEWRHAGLACIQSQGLRQIEVAQHAGERGEVEEAGIAAVKCMFSQTERTGR